MCFKGELCIVYTWHTPPDHHVPSSHCPWAFMGVWALSHSVSQLFLTLLQSPWTVAHQAPLSMGFPRQKYWSGLPFPPPVDLPDPGIKLKSPASPALHADCLSLNHICNSLNDRWLVDITMVTVQFWLTSLPTLQEKIRFTTIVQFNPFSQYTRMLFDFFPLNCLQCLPNSLTQVKQNR